MLTQHSIQKRPHLCKLNRSLALIDRMRQTHLIQSAFQKTAANRLKLKTLKHHQIEAANRLRQVVVRRKEVEQLHYMIYNNLKNEKVMERIEISNIKQFLKIEKVSLIQKKIEPFQNIKNLHIRHPCIKSKRQSILTQLVASSRKSRDNKNHFNHLLQKQKRFYSQEFKHFFQVRMKKYLQRIHKTCNRQQLPFRQFTHHTQKLNYRVQQGNNSDLVEQAFQKRWWWGEDQNGEPSTLADWTQIKHKELQPSDNCRFISNHLQFNKYLTSKAALYQIMDKFGNPSIKVPKIYLVRETKDLQKLKHLWGEKERGNILLNYLLQKKKKLWIVKQLSSQHHNKVLKIIKTEQEANSIINHKTLLNSPFIIEEYIQRPFLYKNRKMHIKMFILITNLNQKARLYSYKEGYVCLATEPYHQNRIQDAYIHFTTQNIQINHHNFGGEQPSNKISFQHFQFYLNSLSNKYSFDNVQCKMKETARFYIGKLKNKIQKSSNPSFQLLEMNFILDKELNPWLISIHTNPFIEETCPLLQGIFPNLIDDVLKLTIDLLVPPPLEWPQDKLSLFSDSMLQNQFEQLDLQGQSLELRELQFENEDAIFEQIKYYQRIAEQFQPRLLTQ